MAVPAISKPVLLFFRRIVRGYFRRHFHGVRGSGVERFLEAGSGGPLIVYANHGSWWDPMVCILLGERMGGRRHYAPMDAAALERYGILKRVGIFGVEMNSPRGAVPFVRTGEAVVRGGGVLWVTPQGRFADTRERPLEFKAGLAAVAVRVAEAEGECGVLPLAIEYPFWDERLPEVLLQFGERVRVVRGEDAEAVQARLVGALEAAMEELKAKAMARDAEAFEELVRGTRGMGGFYALGQRVKAFVRREPYRAEHTRAKTAEVRK